MMFYRTNAEGLVKAVESEKINSWFLMDDKEMAWGDFVPHFRKDKIMMVFDVPSEVDGRNLEGEVSLEHLSHIQAQHGVLGHVYRVLRMTHEGKYSKVHTDLVK